MEFVSCLVMLLGILFFFVSIVALLIQTIRKKGRKRVLVMLFVSIVFTLGGFCGILLTEDSGTAQQDGLTNAEKTVLSYAQTLKDGLADRDSFDLRSVRYYEGMNMNIAELEIGGSNKFGGMVTATYYFYYSSNIGLSIYESTDQMADKLKGTLRENQDDVIKMDCKKIVKYLE